MSRMLTGMLIIAGCLRISAEPMHGQVQVIEFVAPDYPRLARLAMVQGTVEMEVFFGRSGRSTSVTLTAGHPLLSPAARAALLRWRFSACTSVEKQCRQRVVFDFRLVRSGENGAIDRVTAHLPDSVVIREYVPEPLID